MIEDTIVPDAVVPQSVYAVAAADSSSDSFWLIKVCSLHSGDDSSHTDDYHHTIPTGLNFIEGNFLERQHETTKGTLYKVKQKSTFFLQRIYYLPFDKA